MDVSTSVLPELKRETYSKVQVCAKQKLARHGSFNTVQASERIHRNVNSEPSSPAREEQGIYLPLHNPWNPSVHVIVALPVH